MLEKVGCFVPLRLDITERTLPLMRNFPRWSLRPRSFVCGCLKGLSLEPIRMCLYRAPSNNSD